MPMRSTAVFLEDLEQYLYATAWPGERFFKNRLRRRDGKPPLRVRDALR